MKVTVFGGSQPKLGEPAYEDAYRLGKMLGQAGHTVLTGGYIGTMEAVSHGAADAGGHVIGVTCEEIERWRSTSPNPYIMEQMRFPTLGERLMALIFNCDAAIALPGGIGTLAEIATFWNHLVINAFSPRPLVVVGSGWKDTLQTLLKELGGYIPVEHQKFISFATDIDEAFQCIEKSNTQKNQ